MKFKFTPNTTIVDSDRLVNICTFDDNGFFETDNEKIIKFLTTRAKFVKIVDEQITEKSAKPEQKKVEKVAVKDQPQTEEKTETKVYKCNICDFEVENKGQLLAHYRKHKKE